uniref:Ocellatin-4 n=1 Tax=Leptodactylus ocellatus TaxID=928525 RepID=OCE4_LEPOE|nr:RecName: Full=Ocellatin-4 [Leptodactylus bolivianus]
GLLDFVTGVGKDIFAQLIKQI